MTVTATSSSAPAPRSARARRQQLRHRGEGRGHARRYLSERECRQALGRWLHDYNHHRPHSACVKCSPLVGLRNQFLTSEEHFL
ncbi:integrase core domain-containing protein [Corynebacterium propinquum]|uniref:integrase core domain-containing protein n=1 Tax=Corynebacterium propinquum TaxID=43769 RepID=UPI003D2FEC9C